MNTPIKRKDIRAGDRVRMLTEYTHTAGGGMGGGIATTYELIERPATPPTEPGVYLDKDGDLWTLVDSADPPGLLGQYGPYTLLRPVADVAAEFAADLLAFFERPGGGLTTHENDVRLLAAEWATK